MPTPSLPRALRLFVPFLAALSAAACGGGNSPAPDAATPDVVSPEVAEPDSQARDVLAESEPADSPQMDAVVDSATEAATEAAMEAAVEAAPPDALVSDAPSCEAGQRSCVGACTDTQTDPNHCGACGNACANGQTCLSGTCACLPTESTCAGRCANTQTDPTHCGGCSADPGCLPGAPGCRRCSFDQLCVSGACLRACPTGQSACGAACADTNTDPANCGACGRACGTGQLCNAGVCVCPSGQTLCNGACVDLSSNEDNCGACASSTSCTPGTAGCARCAAGQVCNAGVCQVVCPPSQSACGGVCLSTQTDVAHCGNCTTACVAGQSCVDGACACPAGQSVCNASCSNPLTDTNNCGGCSSSPTCAPGTAGCFRCPSGQVCNGGTCALNCTAPQLVCGPRCVRADADPSNCGACGHVCGPTQRCTAGVCTCPTGQSACGTLCMNLQTDTNNCGACSSTGNCSPGTAGCAACQAGDACMAGVCTTCAPGLSACGSTCIDTYSDPNNCGGCGVVCPGAGTGVGAACARGLCLTNLSQARPATQSTNFDALNTYPANFGNDGSTSNAASTGSGVQPWWQVDLGGLYLLEQIDVWNRTDCCQDRLAYFDVLVSDDGATWRPFARQPGMAARPSRYRSFQTGRYVRIQSNATAPQMLNLAEVVVWGQPTALANLALRRAASQSSTWGAAYGAANAVDGVTDGLNFAHTLFEPMPWWQVDLGAVYAVEYVNLWPRWDCCQDRLSNFDVLASLDGTTWTSAAYQSAPVLGRAPARLAIGRTARYLRVQLRGTNALHFLEFEAFGRPLPVLDRSSRAAAQQSSTRLAAANAVDGITTGDFNLAPGAATLVQAQPWWQVDLGTVRAIERVDLWNRSDCCATNLSNYVVRVSNNGIGWRDLPSAGVAGRPTQHPLRQGARYVRVQLTGTNSLNLAEVQVVGP